MVTYSHAHYVLRATGFMGSSAATQLDEWSAGFRLARPAADVAFPVDLTSFLESVAPAISTFHSSAGASASFICHLAELTIARVGTDGKYSPAAQETTRHAYGTPVAGNGTPAHPWSTACVMSLRTVFPRGIASNGRTYWPALAMPLDGSTGRLSSTSQTNFVTAAKTMLDAINTRAEIDLGSDTRVAVVGATGVSGPARSAPVVSIRADRRLDTIERRENDQPPTWLEVALDV